MIIDRIENADLYSSIHPNFKKAFDFLKTVKLEDFTEERIYIEDKNLFAIINDYITKDHSLCELESHKVYIDIQYMVEGEELIGYSALTNQIPSKEYSSESDIMFFPDKPVFYSKITPGMFAVLYPQDLHMPGLMVNSPAPIKKIVVKVKL